MCRRARVGAPRCRLLARGFAASRDASMAEPDLDDLDRKLIDLYQRETRVPAEKLGRAVGLSAAAVQRRLKRLREDGVIVAEVAELAPAALGHPVTCIVGVRLEKDTRAENRRFKDKLAAHPMVQQCYAVTGELDYVLIVLARDMADFDAFTQATLYDDGNVRAFTTQVCLDRVKVGSSVPIR
jgi:Lrp/AsnC family leucine-responsive transcriptional regulator